MSDLLKTIKKLKKSVNAAKKKVEKKVQKETKSYSDITEIKNLLKGNFANLTEDEIVNIRDIGSRHLSSEYEEEVWDFLHANNKNLIEDYFYLVSSISSYLYFGNTPTIFNERIDESKVDINILISLTPSEKIGNNNRELIAYFERQQEYDILMMGNSLLNSYDNQNRVLNIHKPDVTDALAKIFFKIEEKRPSAVFVKPSPAEREREREKLKQVKPDAVVEPINRDKMILSKPLIITPCMRIQRQAPWVNNVKNIYITSDDWDNDDIIADSGLVLGIGLSGTVINGKKWYRPSWIFFEELCKTMVPRGVQQTIGGFNIDIIYRLQDKSIVARDSDITRKENEYYTLKVQEESVIGKINKLVKQTFREFNRSNRIQKIRDTASSQLFSIGEQDCEKDVWKSVTFDTEIYNYFYATAVIICYNEIFGAPEEKIDEKTVIERIGSDETLKKYFAKLAVFYVEMMGYNLLNSIEPGLKYLYIESPRKPEGIINHKQQVEQILENDELPLNVEVPKDIVNIFNEYYYIDNGIEEMRLQIIKSKQSKKTTCDYCNEYILNDIKYTSMDIDKNGEPKILKFCKSKCLDEHSLGN